MLKKIYKDCLKFSYLFIPLNILIVIVYSCQMIIPYIFSSFIDDLTQSYSQDILFTSVKHMLLATLILLLASYIRGLIGSLVSSKVSHLMLKQVDHKLEEIPLSKTRMHDPAYLNNRLFNDIITSVNFSIDSLITALIQVISTIILLVLIANISIWMLLIMIAALSINIIGILIMNKLLYKKGYEYRELNNQYLSCNHERLNNIKETKIHAWYKIASEDVDQAHHMLYEKEKEFNRVKAILDNVGNFSKNISLILTMIAGSMLLIRTKLTIGELVLITTYTNMSLSNIVYFLKLGQGYQHAKVCYNRLDEFLLLENEINGKEQLTSIEKITIDSLGFGYDEDLYNNFNLELHKGNIYCIKGRNGEGKSTLIDLILGLNYEYSGLIKYNDHDIKTLDMKFLRQNKISVILQEPKLQRISVHDNMTRGLNSYDTGDCQSLVKVFDLKHLIDQDDSKSLSGGEKQKVSIVRGLLKNSDLLILDEPVSALDTDSISVLKAQLKQLKTDKIIVFISHNEDLFDIVDEFISIKNYA